MNKLAKIISYAAVTGAPFFALAQTGQAGTIVGQVQTLVNNVIPILLIIGTVVFLWGVIMFLTAGAEEEKRAEARNLMIYGLIGLFVMVAVWGIVNVLVGFFGVGGQGVPSTVGGVGGI